MNYLDVAVARTRLPIRVTIDVERYTCPYWTITSPQGQAMTFDAVHARRAYLAAVSAIQNERELG